MDVFPEKWLPIIAKHVRKQLGLASDAALPAHVASRLVQLRASEIARLNGVVAA